MLGRNDTIAAIATPHGVGAIGIVRVSGPDAERISHILFRPVVDTDYLEPRRLYRGDILSHETCCAIDEVLLTLMKKPHSYTGEDTLEINCHGGHLILQTVLNEVIQAGARIAEPGEFTRRAYLNGRLDLSQAEAVIDLITARTNRGRALALSGLKGTLSKKLQSIRSSLIEILASLESSMDFSDEDISSKPHRDLSRDVEDVIILINDILLTYREGRLLRDGLNVVITGSPNVGKSSLLNRLLGERRAIVTSIPGTTRDFIEETININGIPVRLTDTAGVRKSEEPIEKEGIAFVWEKVLAADIVIVLINGNASLADEDFGVIRRNSSKRMVVAINKADLPHKITNADITDIVPGIEPLWISAKFGYGISELKEKICSPVSGSGNYMEADVILTNLRHKNALKKTVDSLTAAKYNILPEAYRELAAFDIRDALDHLGDIVGETTTEDVLDRIFSSFCIGK
ncbi:MAG: tRNA uridine-5-carboxymethylaminomethyl(34) synthesis GTPase MnmE [Thermodesulfobacteriota bacterium]|nr:tRNA uridine-5-carboxymethylaminomethyl(34) synthesis GTPase MnmE [Thermodesulfobacteriota bacterium]